MASKIIYKKDEYQIKNKRYIQIGIKPIEKDIFDELIAIFKKGFAFYLPEQKSWFIRSYGWNRLEKEVEEKIDNLVDDIEDVREELVKKVLEKKAIEMMKTKDGEIDEDLNEDFYGDEFIKIKAKLKVKQDGKCFICGKRASVCHHVVPISLGGKTEENNLVLLCRTCHARLHGYYRHKAQVGMFKRDTNFFKKCIDDLKSDFDKEKQKL